jgi:hypothetical protein
VAVASNYLGGVQVGCSEVNQKHVEVHGLRTSWRAFWVPLAARRSPLAARRTQKNRAKNRGPREEKKTKAGGDFVDEPRWQMDFFGESFFPVFFCFKEKKPNKTNVRTYIYSA